MQGTPPPGSAVPPRGVAGRDFTFGDRSEEVREGPTGIAGLFCHSFGALGEPRGLQRGGEGVDLFAGIRSLGCHQNISPARGERAVIICQVPFQLPACCRHGVRVLEFGAQALGGEHMGGIRDGHSPGPDPDMACDDPAVGPDSDPFQVGADIDQTPDAARVHGVVIVSSRT